MSWSLSVLGAEGPAELEPVSGDASARRYFRLRLDGGSFMVVDAPPDSQKNAEFLAVRELLCAAGITVPDLHGADLSRGCLLLGDLGDRLLLQELDPAADGAPYQRALAVLLAMASIDPADPHWPRYDDALFSEELGRFPQWFVEQLLELPAPDDSIWQAFTEVLKASALEQPTVLVHRDFHSRNLMPQPDGALAVIDFQDAVIGPVTYDLVSLLRDCYIRWQPQQVEAWALSYLGMLRQRGQLMSIDDARFLAWFDLMGLQRHIKVLGTFARLFIRDGKPAYLHDLPLVIRYVREMLHKYRGEVAAIAAFDHWFETELMPVIRQQSWSAGQ
ncbi:aminoglycoside phosphotransferase [Seongchinamella unica]|uniref:Aminoglycoside phosphotransferase n=1 Tax=Seongchinamella unica TaxID=2547392 RepID=A0A4R5LNA6_9GAMM|nr:phosphotransferase [Seongchinamella unica]TDG11604.1 aminoglycoside phosphotransferase [Seongchinamella unica]